VRTTEKKMMGLKKQTTEYILFFNAIDGTLLRIKNKNFMQYGLFGEIINLRKDQLQVLNLINDMNNVTTTDLVNETGQNPAAINKKLTEFASKELILFEKEGKNFVNISLAHEEVKKATEKYPDNEQLVEADE